MHVNFGGKSVHLYGTPLKPGMNIPPFTLTDHALKDVSSSVLKGPVILLSFPSVDTSACSLELLTFNDRLESYPHFKVYGISMDLPFTQERWVRNNAGDYVTMLSDHKFREFGEVTGTFIEELGFLTRAAFVLDRDGIATYVEYVEEIGNEPDYDAIMEAAQVVFSNSES